jgi:hypothetical protein
MMRCYARFLSSNCCKVHFHRLGLLRLSRRATSTPGPHLLYFVCVRFVLYLYHCACVLWLVSHIFKTRFFVLGIIIISLSLSCFHSSKPSVQVSQERRLEASHTADPDYVPKRSTHTPISYCPASLLLLNLVYVFLLGRHLYSQ